MNNIPVIYLDRINMGYKDKEIYLEILKEISLTISKGEYIAILGPSGSGKSTLMYIIGCLSTPTTGSYFLFGEEINKLKKSELAKIRNEKIGFVFQNFNLLPQITAVDNILLPLMYQGKRIRKHKHEAEELLFKLGIRKNLMYYNPNRLSGGEQQRVAIARALINQPDIILADEPTGNLDTQSGKDVVNLLEDRIEEGKTLIIVTHDFTIAKRASRIIKIVDGRIIL